MRRKNRKLAKKQKVYTKKKRPITHKKKNSRRPRIAITDPRVVRALGAMRREGISASQAARGERM